MLAWYMLAPTWQPAQPAPPSPPQPTEAQFIVRDAYSGHVGRLLNLWAREGAIASAPRTLPASSIADCLPRDRVGAIEAGCIQDRLGRQMTAPAGPVVAIVARDSGRRAPAINVACVGRNGAGEASINVNTGGAFSPIAEVRNRSRADLARCIDRAVRGAAPYFDQWNTGSSGHPVYSYHRIAGDCAGLEHAVGRNAVGGRWTVPIGEVRWTLAVPGGVHPAAIQFDCLSDDPCIRFERGSERSALRSHAVPFGLESSARGTEMRLAPLARACAATDRRAR